MAATEVLTDERLTYRPLAAVDIEGFSKLNVLDQRRSQADLALVLEKAAAESGLDRSRWGVQVSGDGELAVLPPDTNLLRLVADYPREFAKAVVAVNRARSDHPKLRIRLALHHGAIAPGRLGPVGNAPIVVSRLLDSDALRRRLANNEEIDVAVVVSARLYQDVIETRFAGLEPGNFAYVGFDAKGTSYAGYIFQGTWPERAPRRARWYRRH